MKLYAFVVLVAVAFGAPAAPAATIEVSADDFFYSPTPRKVKLGDSVVWHNESGFTPHTATSDGAADGSSFTGLGLWDTKSIGGGKSSTALTFNWSGTFNYHCSFHGDQFGMIGKLKVTPSASPKTGATSTSFTISWAKTAPPSGIVFDVKIKRPGQKFARLTPPNGTTDLSTSFTPDAGPGTYSFRARLRDPAKGLTSGYSPARRVTVS